MNESSGQHEPPPRWQPRPRTTEPAHDAPPADDVLHHELVRIQHRVEDVLAQGREAFAEGSDSYDRATVAILRLAALFEDEKRYSPHLSVVTLEERRGITTTRNLVAHSGYGAMNTEIFWRTVTERLPEVIARIRGTLRL
ncbi:antitoxin [Brachybacterium fresconis]|uniref:Antitoxin n=1 Tax=Brachybacterium fresconis TaxID=173363 RepID=A0ABS4YJY6_9MICO|nr:antitoxin [Brachybacterium fresconis]MBP2409064.1 hypothetical protein [Brachybacterium fresconis]